MFIADIFKAAIGTHGKYKTWASSRPLLLTLTGILLLVAGALLSALAGSTMLEGNPEAAQALQWLMAKLPEAWRPQLTPTALAAAGLPTGANGLSMIFAVIAKIVDHGPNLPPSTVTQPTPVQPVPSNHLPDDSCIVQLREEISLRQKWEDYAHDLEAALAQTFQRKEQYKINFINERAWRRILLRAPFVSIGLAFVCLLASWIYPIAGHPAGAWLRPMEEALHGLGLFSPETWHGITGLVLTLGSGAGLGLYFSRGRFWMFKESVFTADGSLAFEPDKYPVRIPFLEIAVVVGLAALVANLSYLLISCGYHRFYVEEAAGAPGAGPARSFDNLSLVVLYRVLALPVAAMAGIGLTALVKRSPRSYWKATSNETSI